MSVNRWKLVAMPVLMLGLSAPMLVNCGVIPKDKLPGGLGEVVDAASGCDEMKSGGDAIAALAARLGAPEVHGAYDEEPWARRRDARCAPQGFGVDGAACADGREDRHEHPRGAADVPGHRPA